MLEAWVEWLETGTSVPQALHHREQKDLKKTLSRMAMDGENIS